MTAAISDRISSEIFTQPPRKSFDKLQTIIDWQRKQFDEIKTMSRNYYNFCFVDRPSRSVKETT
jgi:hypothetical protein